MSWRLDDVGCFFFFNVFFFHVTGSPPVPPKKTNTNEFRLKEKRIVFPKRKGMGRPVLAVFQYVSFQRSSGRGKFQGFAKNEKFNPRVLRSSAKS